MSQVRENKNKKLTSHRVATMLMSTSLLARMIMAFGPGICVAWRKEAAP